MIQFIFGAIYGFELIMQEKILLTRLTTSSLTERIQGSQCKSSTDLRVGQLDADRFGSMGPNSLIVIERMVVGLE